MNLLFLPLGGLGRLLWGHSLRLCWLGSLFLLLPFCVLLAQPLYEKSEHFVPKGELDSLFLKEASGRGLQPVGLCSDAVFIRRVYLDVTGGLPLVEDTRRFLRDGSPDKRAALIDALLESEAHAWYRTLQWCDLLRVKAEFPINLWPNGVQAYHRWIFASLRDGKGYDVFARELLTSSGSNFRVPAVNFYRAMQGTEPEDMARAVALTFMGVRLESWPDAKQADLATFFSRLRFKGTAEWKETIVYLDPAQYVPLRAVFPDGSSLVIPAGQDPRDFFADWLTGKKNGWFARNAVNREWAWLFGRGLIHEPDDMRPDNPSVYPALLARLETELVEADYDLTHVRRLILNSAIYQQTCLPRGDAEKAARYFTCYPIRRLSAEVLSDAINAVLGGEESYSSAIPEPFTFVPENQPTVHLADGSITSPFLEMFGRPARDTGYFTERSNAPSAGQCLYLLNASRLQEKISRSRILKGLVRRLDGDVRIVQALYLMTLSRFATREEVRVALVALGDGKRQQGVQDLAWALINSKEFLYQH